MAVPTEASWIAAAEEGERLVVVWLDISFVSICFFFLCETVFEQIVEVGENAVCWERERKRERESQMCLVRMERV